MGGGRTWSGSIEARALEPTTATSFDGAMVYLDVDVQPSVKENLLAVQWQNRRAAYFLRRWWEAVFFSLRPRKKSDFCGWLAPASGSAFGRSRSRGSATSVRSGLRLSTSNVGAHPEG